MGENTERIIDIILDRKRESEKWLNVLYELKLLDLSEAAFKECQTKISSRLAQLDISIRDHMKELKK